MPTKPRRTRFSSLPDPTPAPEVSELLEEFLDRASVDTALSVNPLTGQPLTNSERGRAGALINRLRAASPDFDQQVEELQAGWLAEADTVLSELLALIRVKAPMAELKDVVKAVHVLAQQHRLEQGLPTSLAAVDHQHRVKRLDDAELEKRIALLKKHLGGFVERRQLPPVESEAL